MNKAIFLDRDGTLNIDYGYVHEIDNFKFIDGAIDALRELKIDPTQSIMVGDKVEDLKAGIGAKVKMNVLVRTGKPVTGEGEGIADYVLDSIVDLPRILKRLKK